MFEPRPSQHKPALLIDLDGVLRLWPAVDADVEAAFGLPAGLIHRIAFEPKRLMAAITGRISDEQWRSQIIERLSTEHAGVDAALAVQRWSEPIGQLNLGVLQALRVARKHATVVLLTNATTRLPQDLKALGLEREFDLIINSCRVGVAKPDAGLFRTAMQAADVRAEQTLYVDDTLGHIEAARAIGLRCHHYTGPAGDSALLDFLTRELGPYFRSSTA